MKHDFYFLAWLINSKFRKIWEKVQKERKNEMERERERATCSGLSLCWDHSHADSIGCSSCSHWALRKPLHHAWKEEPGKCVVPQRVMTEGPYRTPCCNNMMLQGVLSGVVSGDAPGACVAQKGNRGSNGGSSCMCCAEMISCQQIQV